MQGPCPLPGFQRRAERQLLGHSPVKCLFMRDLQQASSHLADCAPLCSTAMAARDTLTDHRQHWGETWQGAHPGQFSKRNAHRSWVPVQRLTSVQRFLCGKKAWMVTTTIYNHSIQPFRVCNGEAKVNFTGGGKQTAPCWVWHQPQRPGSFLCN